MHIWNRLQRIKSVKMIIETSDKIQCSYFDVMNPFLKFRSGEHIAQLLNAMHLLVIEKITTVDSIIYDFPKQIKECCSREIFVFWSA